MKQKRIVSMIGALVLIISAVVLITGCPKANNNNGKVVDKAVYVAQMDDNGTTITITMTFKADGTFMCRETMGNASVVMMQGTYTGDPSKDGAITITVKKRAQPGGTLVDEANPTPKNITISGGKLSFEGIDFIRQ